MTIIAVCVLALLLLSGLIFYALRRKGRVRAAFKGPLAVFSFEFEADDTKKPPSK